MKIETNKTTNTKRIGALVATCAALFALTLMVIPAHKALADNTEDTYDVTDWGSSPTYDVTDWGGSPTYDVTDWGNDYKSADSTGYQTSNYSYDTPIYGSSPSYSSPSYYSTPSYNYSTPSSHYVQSSQPCSSCGGSSYQPYKPMTYVPQGSSASAPNTNVNTNSNGQSQSSNNSNKSNSTSVSSNTTSNSGNNVNNNQSNSQSNNNINVVFYGGAATSTYSAQGTVQDQTLNGYCTISPSVVDVNQDVTFIATATGGTGSYNYNWSGNDGLSSHSQSFTGRFGSIGTKTATLTIQSGNQVITRTCNVQVGGSTYNPYPPVTNNVSAYCTANPTFANVGQQVTWTVYVNNNNTYGNNSGYTYNWSGTDNLYGYGQSIPMTYNTAGTKQAYVTITGNGQTTTATCNTTIGGSAVSNVTVYRQPNQGTPVSGVFLSQVPATGIDLNLKTTLFAVGLLMWSAFVAYYMIAKRKAQMKLATIAGGNKAEAFKFANMQKRGLIS